jgi:hypothetical protein
MDYAAASARPATRHKGARGAPEARDVPRRARAAGQAAGRSPAKRPGGPSLSGGLSAWVAETDIQPGISDQPHKSPVPGELRRTGASGNRPGRSAGGVPTVFLFIYFSRLRIIIRRIISHFRNAESKSCPPRDAALEPKRAVERKQALNPRNGTTVIMTEFFLYIRALPFHTGFADRGSVTHERFGHGHRGGGPRRASQTR